MESVDFETAFMLFRQVKLPGSDLPIKTWPDMKLKDMAGKGGDVWTRTSELLSSEDFMVNSFVVPWVGARTANFCTQTPAL